MKENSVILMNFSGIYETETFYEKWQGMEVLWLDCRDIQGTNCYCDEVGERALKQRIEPLGPGGIHFLDSGNYHYVTKLWLDQIKEPFEMLVFDHHTDMQQPVFGDILSCGGWILEALEQNEHLNHVFLAGPPEEAVKKAKQEISEELQRKVTWISEKEMGKGLDFQSGQTELSGQTQSPLPVYISIDKDILSPSFARTNWDQGEADPADVCRLIQTFLARRPLIGMDVCGENPEGADGPEAEEERRINDAANEAVLKLYSGHIGRMQACQGKEYYQ